MESRRRKEWGGLGHDVATLLETMPKPTIAAINGFALGGGCELALACDIRYASSRAKLGQPEINLGIIPGWGGTQRLARACGIGFAKELILTGRVVDAEEALRRGLVNAVHDPVLEKALETARLLASKSPLALAAAKAATNDALQGDHAENLRREAEHFGGLFSTRGREGGSERVHREARAEVRRVASCSFAVCLSNFGTYADPHAAVRVAQAAEAAGWDGFFVWDHLAFVWGPPSADPWVTLAAVAAATETLTLGTAVTPLPRRRPQVVAQQLATLEALNGGRVVLGAGLGGNEKEFTAFGEDFDPHRRAKLLDDGLKIVREQLAGPDLDRRQQRAGAPPCLPLGRLGREQRRDRGHDDDAGRARAEGGSDRPRPRLRRRVQRLLVRRRRALCADYADAGATWWLENLHDRRLAPDELLARVAAGPAS